MIRPVLILIAALVVAADAQSQSVLRRHEGQTYPELDQFGSAVSPLGDVDADTLPDYAIAAMWWDAAEHLSGGVRAYSGADGSVLWAFASADENAMLGASMTAVPDANSDGKRDLLVGAPLHDDSFGLSTGAVFLLSGADGAVLDTFYGDETSDRFGIWVAIGGDCDGDTVDDYLVLSDPLDDADGNNFVRVISGASRQVLHTTVLAENWQPQQVLADAGDWNQDGFDDYAVARSRIVLGPDVVGGVRIYSGLDGSVLDVFPGDPNGPSTEEFGVTVGNVADLSGDGRDDLVFGWDRAWDSFGTAAVVIEGGSGNTLFELTYLPFDDSPVAHRFDSGGDFNGDGVRDILVSTGNDQVNGTRSGTAYGYSGSDGALLFAHAGMTVDAEFGSSVAFLGDLDGDGFDDVISGAVDARPRAYVEILAGADSYLALSPPAPGVVGVPNTLTAVGAAPGSTVVWFARDRRGQTWVDCDGSSVSMNLHRAKLLGSSIADNTGVATYTRNVPVAFSGRKFRLQALEFNACRSTNPVEYRFP